MQRTSRLYVSESTHFTVARAAQMIGMGLDHAVPIPNLGRGSMDVGQLEKQIQQDIDHGMQPFAVIATLGTTGTGAVDPLKEIAKLCVNRNLWLHADACYGGAAKLAPHLQHLFKGMQMADSLSVDPDKWFFIPTALLAVIKLSRGPFWVGFITNIEWRRLRHEN